jgi:hypothetical protein
MHSLRHDQPSTFQALGVSSGDCVLVYRFSQLIWLIAAVAGSLESPRFLLSGKPAIAVIRQKNS